MGGGSGSGGSGGGYKSGRVIGPKSSRNKGSSSAINSSAYQQVHDAQQVFKSSFIGSLPTTGNIMANFAYGKMKSDLTTPGSSAVVAAGTGYAPQGQGYTEAPGMMSDPSLAAQTGLAGSIGQMSSTSQPTSGKGYGGTVVGTVGPGLFGIGKVYSGKTGYSPIGKNVDLTAPVISMSPSTADVGGGKDAPIAPSSSVAEEEDVPAPAMLPGETRSQYRRRVRRFGGGTIVEGGGVLYK